jgi:predicted transcriptional regulator
MDQDNRAMSPREFERLLEALGLSKAAAGRWLGVSERTVHRYADGDAEVPVSTVFLLRLFVEQDRLPKVPPRPRPVVAEHPIPTAP